MDAVVEKMDYRVVMILTQIMDVAYAHKVLSFMQHKSRVTVIGNDRYTAEEIMGVTGRLRFFAGMRLHSLILATAMNVPSIGLAYAPKVRHFMHLMNAQDSILELADFSPETFIAHIRRLGRLDATRQRTQDQGSRRLPPPGRPLSALIAVASLLNRRQTTSPTTCGTSATGFRGRPAAGLIGDPWH